MQLAPFCEGASMAALSRQVQRLNSGTTPLGQFQNSAP
jgi:hypothetical protein